jgi:hypothetical protein
MERSYTSLPACLHCLYAFDALPTGTGGSLVNSELCFDQLGGTLRGYHSRAPPDDGEEAYKYGYPRFHSLNDS